MPQIAFSGYLSAVLRYNTHATQRHGILSMTAFRDEQSLRSQRQVCQV
jgi:hypothetical protein